MTTALRKPIQLLPAFRERVWGKRDLSPLYPIQAGPQPIGEVWFTAKDNLTSFGKPLQSLLAEHPEALGTAINHQYPDLCPLLVKILFTTERLSIQVHPDDEYAAKHHDCLGKTEAWYVMDSVPPGEVATGFCEQITADRLENAALSGEIAQLLEWRKVQKGDLVFTPAGTVHAIGAGLTICEIQQNSDITYRLYDYGRPRELHLEEAKEVSTLTPHQEQAHRIELTPGRAQLLECPYFRIEHLSVPDEFNLTGGNESYFLLVSLKGEGEIGGEPFSAGQVWFVPAEADCFQVEGPGSEWLVTYTADSHYRGLRLS